MSDRDGGRPFKSQFSKDTLTYAKPTMLQPADHVAQLKRCLALGIVMRVCEECNWPRPAKSLTGCMCVDK
jgi:hypothetical protein